MPSGMSVCQPVPPKFKSDKGPFRAVHGCYENREMMICHKWKRAEWFCRKADGKRKIDVEVRSERFIPNVGASRVDKNLTWHLMERWFLIYFWKSLKRQSSFHLGTNGSEKAPLDMWEVLNCWFIMNISWSLHFSPIIKCVEMPKGGYLMLQISRETH